MDQTGPPPPWKTENFTEMFIIKYCYILIKPKFLKNFLDFLYLSWNSYYHFIIFFPIPNQPFFYLQIDFCISYNHIAAFHLFLIGFGIFLKPFLQLFPTWQIYVRGIFMEHSHDIFPEYSEKVTYEIPGNIAKYYSRNIEYRNIRWFFNEYPTNVTFIILGGSRNTVVDKAVPDIRCVFMKIWYFHESLVSMWPLPITVPQLIITVIIKFYKVVTM